MTASTNVEVPWLNGSCCPAYIDTSIWTSAPQNILQAPSKELYNLFLTDHFIQGGTQTLCTYPYNATLQGTIPQGFFRSVAFAKGIGITGQPYVQLTGCIVPQLVDRMSVMILPFFFSLADEVPQRQGLNPADAGGQYDSNGGVTLQGNPIGSQCLGYASYVELIEPAGPRACIRCCIDPVDCPVTLVRSLRRPLIIPSLTAMKTTFTTLLFAGFAAFVGAGLVNKRAVFSDINSVSPDNIVYIADAETFCMIMPRTAHTDIGVSETPGGEQTYCTKPYSPLQGTIPPGFFRNISFVQAKGNSGQPYVQITGCIDPTQIDRLNANDGGGQYDSNGGDGGRGNPENSKCIGYSSYVEMVEPSSRHACLRCCTDDSDCNVGMDTSGCSAIIPGEYFC
ncbi:hypothetical protein FRC04_008310 [Tulasnella sp. 424]|nr:hypothetical protein FRC04_008310 [Tulasnella sp. 424]KAG8970283.1 hypothetical protein FRC05_000657 [Tulasnella sp. 425]